VKCEVSAANAPGEAMVLAKAASKPAWRKERRSREEVMKV
jgi:hypothetical protein